MKWLQRAIRPALLAACGLVYLIFIYEIVQYHYRLYVVRSMLADVQTLHVGTSSYADAAEVAGRHHTFLQPSSDCTKDNCIWSVLVYNGFCGGLIYFLNPPKTQACDILDRFNESVTLNALGFRLSWAAVWFRARDGLVKTSGAYVDARGPDRDWPPMSWEFLPDKPEAWMTSSETRLYDRDGYRGKRGWVELITPSTPDDEKRKSFSLISNCLDSLSGCFSLKERLRGDKAGPAGVTWGAWRIRRGPTVNATIFYIGLLGIGIGSICLWASRARAVRSRGQAFLLMSTGVVLMVLGVTAVYITQVADDVSLWVWFVAALIFIILLRFGPPAIQTVLWRFPAYGSIAVFTGSLLGGLLELEDFAGLVVVAAVLVPWGIIALQTPNTVPEKVIHATVCVAAPMFNIALYLLSRLQVIDHEGEVVAALKMPFQQWVALPEWFDRLELDIWLKIALISSFLLVGILSATYFAMRAQRSRRHVQALAV